MYTGSFPSIHLSSECHCPPSHPLIDTNNPATCVQHPPNQGRVDRINPLAHPPSFANDFSTSQRWISATGDRNVNITFQLTNSLYEVRGLILTIVHLFLFSSLLRGQILTSLVYLYPKHAFLFLFFLLFWHGRDTVSFVPRLIPSFSEKLGMGLGTRLGLMLFLKCTTVLLRVHVRVHVSIPSFSNLQLLFHLLLFNQI